MAFGALFQLARELKRGGEGDFAERSLLGLLGLHRRVDSEEGFDLGRYGVGDAFFQEMEHELSSVLPVVC